MQSIPRIIGWSELKTIVPYTRQHIHRLERARLFPRRVRIGANRIGWLLSEIEAWLADRVDARDALETPTHARANNPDNR